MWRTSKREFDLFRPIVMGILNVTPDSFSDGGRYADLDAALRRAEVMIREGAGIIDIGGESTRPGSARVQESVEIERVVPVIETIASRFDVPISIDTWKSRVAEAAVNAGAEIINDISALRFDARVAHVAAKYNTGLVLMHSRGEFETMHSQPPVADIFADVTNDFDRAINAATAGGVSAENIALDAGIGFGKTFDQNLELIAKLDRLVDAYSAYPILVGVSRKSFIGKILGGAPTDDRLSGSLVAAAIAAWNGAKVIRAHDVAETVKAIAVTAEIREHATI